MSTSDSVSAPEEPAIGLTVEQLLELRHIPSPTARRTPVSNSTWLGAFTSPRRGHGTDYDDLRPYSPGDDIRHIDWRASARTDELHTRLYREEKDHRTRIICDLRPCMFTGSIMLRARRAVMLSARLLWQACHGGTRVSLIVITPSGASTTAPGAGHATAIRGCNLLAREHQRIAHELGRRHRHPGPTINTDSAADGQSESHSDPDKTMTDEHSRQHALTVLNTTSGPTLDAVLQWLIAQDELKTTQLWVSGFDYTGSEFFKSLESVSRQTLNLAIQIDDPVLSTSLPAGDFHYRSHQTTGSRLVTSYRRALLGRSNQRVLEDKLKQIKRTRTAHFDQLMIPYLSAANGDDEVISALRHSACLA